MGDVLVSASAGWITDHEELFAAPQGPAFTAEAYIPNEDMPTGTYFQTSAFVVAFGWNTQGLPGGTAIWVPPLTSQQETGAPVDWGISKPAWGTVFHAMILNSAPHPNAAQLLTNFMITPAGQEAMAFNGASVLTDVPTAVISLSDVVAAKTAELTPERMREFQTRWTTLFRG